MRTAEQRHASYIRHRDKRWAKDGNLCPICSKLIKPSAKTCKQHNAMLINHPKGPEALAWKRGYFTRPDGYISVYKPDHPRASGGYVAAHIVAWEEAQGKPIPPGWVVHHLNGLPGDNRTSNLIALPDRKHRNLLAVKAKRIQELEALLREQGQLL